MATTIKSTALDFDTIKNNLKTFFAAKEEFTDYEFEASGLSNLLDVLAYNTHYNALIANYALNESFLGTAQLRSSLVSLSEAIGYVPGSRSASTAYVNIKTTLTGVNLPQKITIDPGFKFTSSVNDITYTFQTRDQITANNDGGGNYTFKTDSQNPENIAIYEGTRKTKTFIVGPVSETELYVIPDKNLDLNTAIIKVFENASAVEYTIYTNLELATAITSDSQIYVLKETPNGFYELSFGNGNTLGITPSAGNKVEVEYISCSGSIANGAKVFTSTEQLAVTKTNGDVIETVIDNTTIFSSIGGSEKETNESIRKNAPFQYTTQNRMVTAADYSTLIFRNFNQYIEEIQSWGGEDADVPEYGAVFTSINFINGLTASEITALKRRIKEYVNNLSIVSFNLRFADPIITYIEARVFYQYNPKFTTLGSNAVKANVQSAIDLYFANNIGNFTQSFRRSNLLTEVDKVDPSVLSSRSEIRMQQRLIPQTVSADGLTVTSKLGITTNYLLRFPAAIAAPDDKQYIITSSLFTYANRTCYLRNKLNSNVIQIIDQASSAPFLSNIGTYDAVLGSIRLTGFAPQNITNNVPYIKISALPGNQSAISPARNNILEYDTDLSLTRPVIVESN
jgi:hypothetical protein